MDYIRKSFVNGDVSLVPADDSGIKLLDGIEFR